MAVNKSKFEGDDLPTPMDVLSGDHPDTMDRVPDPNTPGPVVGGDEHGVLSHSGSGNKAVK